MPFRSDGI